jgi:hypothetical protein
MSHEHRDATAIEEVSIVLVGDLVIGDEGVG